MPRSYYSGAWSADSQWFFYTVHDQAYRPHEVWRHRIGTPVTEDVRVLVEPDERFDADRAGEPVRGRSCWCSARAATPARCGRSTPAHPSRRRARSVGAGRGCSTAPSTCATAAAAAGDQRRRGRVPAGLGTRPGRRPGPHRLARVRPEDPAERLERVDAFAGTCVLSLRTEAEHRLRVVPADDPASEGFVVRSRFPGGAVRLARNPTYDAGAVTVVDQAYVEPPVWSDLDLASGERTDVLRRGGAGSRSRAVRHLPHRRARPTDGDTRPSR